MKPTDSTRLIYSAFGLPHTPRKVGSGVTARSIEANLPKVDKKSIYLLEIMIVDGSSPFRAWLISSLAVAVALSNFSAISISYYLATILIASEST